MAEGTGVILGADGKSIYDSPPKRNYQQIPLQAFSDWSTVNAVKSTLNELEQGGNFRMPALLWDAMGRDDRVAGVFETRINSLNGLPLEFEPADDSAKAVQIAADLKAQWPKMVPEAALNELRSWGLGIQLGIGELDWQDVGASMWMPVLRPWNPQYAYWRWDRWSYWISTQDQGTVEVNAGELGAWKWVLYVPGGHGRAGWMKALVRSLSIPWLIRQWDWRDWARYNEIHGIPVRAGIVPAGGSEQHKERFLNELAALGNETTIRLEQSEKEKFDFKLVESMGTNWETFDKLSTKADTAVAVRILGQNLTTEAGTSSSGGGLGGKGMGQIHDRVRSDFLRSDGVTTSECLREQMLEPWALFNYGSKSLAPRPKWQTDPPDDKNKKADTFLKIGQAIQVWSQGAPDVPLDVQQIAKDFAIPTLEADSPRQQLPEGTPPSTITPPRELTPELSSKQIRSGLQSARRRKVSLKPHVDGQVFTDELGDHGVAAARAVMRKDLAKVLAAVNKATNWGELRMLLKEAFADMDPSQLAAIQRKALVLAELNGRHAVLEEL